MSNDIAMLEDAGAARIALSPLRRELLTRLRTPASASMLSEALNMPRQKLGYHLRVLEQAGLITASETRQRRGFTEKLYRARGDALIVDPMIMGADDPAHVEAQDRHAATHLVRTAAAIVRDVSRMQAAAESENSRLLTFTVEADVGFEHPADIETFTARLSDALAAIAADFAPPGRGRRYQVTIAGHPATATRPAAAVN
ncbi:MAG: helix-turn-helix domain-containing protein [Sphingopyxis sp.]|uniref:helix-turn-helix domain-containing protein n=1 Tax=Sphingopyxis sp. TaxID=1908224 RepID=UPI002AB955CD|nr:helix-turn-helix domain-containing protein [Sphingopyxis sp.]MDZ3831034.1 helix-turn-helix domain-containing protein [Sphingopyxis sp.]